MTTLNVCTRLFLCLLAAILTLSFAACRPQTSPENPDAPSDEQTTAAPESVESMHESTAETETDPVGSIHESTAETETEPDDGIPLDAFTIGGVSITEFTLVVQEGGAACVRNSADELVQYLEQATGGFRIEEKASEHEIVIGVTDRDTPAVTEARAKVELDVYTMLEEDGKLTFYVDEGKFTGEKIEEAFFGCGGVAEIDNLQPKLITMAKAGFRHHTTVGVGHMAKVLKEAFSYLGYDVIDI